MNNLIARANLDDDAIVDETKGKVRFESILTGEGAPTDPPPVPEKGWAYYDITDDEAAVEYVWDPGTTTWIPTGGGTGGAGVTKDYINIFSEFGEEDDFDAIIAFVLATNGSIGPINNMLLYAFKPTVGAVILRGRGSGLPPVLDDEQPVLSKTYHSHIYSTNGGANQQFGQRHWETRPDLGVTHPHQIVVVGETRSVNGGDHAIDYDGTVVVDLTGGSDVNLAYPAAAGGGDQQSQRLVFVVRELDGYVCTIDPPIQGVDRLPVGVWVARDGIDGYSWDRHPYYEVGNVLASVVLYAPDRTTEDLEVVLGETIYWVEYDPGHVGAGDGGAELDDWSTTSSFNWTGTWATDNARTNVLLKLDGDFWPSMVVEPTSTGFTRRWLNGGTHVALGCGGALMGEPSLWIGMNTGNGDNEGGAPVPNLLATWFQPAGLNADHVRVNVDGGMSLSNWIDIYGGVNGWKEDILRSNFGGTSVAAGAAAGATGSASLAPGSNDAAGSVSVTVTATPSTGRLATVTFDTAFPGLAVPVISPADMDAAGTVGVYAVPADFPTTAFGIEAASALAEGEYQWSYHVIGVPD